MFASAALVLASITVGEGHGPELHARLTHISGAVVLVTIESRERLEVPEALPAVPLTPHADGFIYVPADVPGNRRGSVIRVRVGEVLKSDLALEPGGRADVFDPTPAAVIESWIPKVGERYVLFLTRPAPTDRQRLERDMVLRRVPAGSGGEGSLLNLDATYSLVSMSRGAIRVDTMKPDALQALRDDVRAANRPRVTLTSPAVGAVLSGQVTLAATAHDDGGVLGVQFQVDGQSVAPELEQRPFQLAWRSKSVPNGAHTISTIARDATGESTTATVSVTTANTNAPPEVRADPTSATGGAHTFTWSWLDPDGDPLACQFEVLQPAQCTFAGQCHAAGGSPSGSVSCQAKVEFGQPHGTACDYRLTCNDGWAVPVAATFRLYYPNLY